MMTTAVVASTLSTKFCFETFSLTCAKTIEMVAYLAKNTHPSLEEVNIILVDFDLTVKLTQIQQLINEFHDKEKTGYIFRTSIKIALGDVDNAVKNLNQILSSLKSAKEYHEARYFNTWRSLNCDQLVRELKTANKVLVQRFNDLEKIVTISRYLD
jgi:glutaredoxin-related protein